MSNQSKVRIELNNVLQRRTAHHVHHNGRTVAIRAVDPNDKSNNRVELRYSDGTIHTNLSPFTAEELAETFLGITPPLPPKRHSIPLGYRTGWSVSLRRDEVWPQDPGNGCPAVVCGPFGVSSTFNCALNEGWVSGRDGDVEIPGHVYRVLDSAKVMWAVEEYLHDCERYWARVDPTR